MQRKYVGVPEVAERWGLTHWSVRRALMRGLPYTKLGGAIRIDLADLERFEAAHKRHGGARGEAGAAARNS